MKKKNKTLFLHNFFHPLFTLLKFYVFICNHKEISGKNRVLELKTKDKKMHANFQKGICKTRKNTLIRTTY